MATVSIVFMALVAAGCKKKTVAPVVEAKPQLESVYTNRMNDAAYVESLRSNRVAQSVQANERHVLTQQLKVCRERVRAALPADAGEAALTNALARDPEWQQLEARREQMDGRIQATLLDAQEAIRKRMEAEAQAVKAVAAGRAEAADRPTAPQ
jgi:PBP1b-binding outer membrane lipoprotein LpoB